MQAQRYVDTGNTFYNKGKFKEAAIMYRRALQKDLRFGEAHYRLGLTQMKLGSFGAAAGELRRAVELQPNNSDAAVKLADIFVVASTQDTAHQAQLLDEVKDLSGRLLQRDPNSYDGHRIQGQVALLTKNFPEAVKEFQKADAVKPSQAELSVAYFGALAANQQFAEAEKLARGVIAQHKDFSPIYDVLYVQYMRQNKQSEAEAVLKLKVQNNPKNSTYALQLVQHYFLVNHRPELDAAVATLTDEKMFPEGHLLAGDFFYFRAREFDRAQREYEAGMKAFPKDKALYQKRMIELYAVTGKNPEANQLLAIVLKENPKDTDAIAMRAALMLTTGNRDQINAAANDLQALVTKNPQNHLLRFNLARAMLAKGDADGARLQLEEAVKIRTDFLVARELLGRIYLAKGDYAKALKNSDDIIAMDRNNLQAHLTRSSALLGIGDKDKAREELTGITKAFPQSADAKYQIGFLAYQEKDYKRAEQIWGDLYKQNPNDRRGLIGVTETLAAQNRISDSIKEMEKAVEREPQRRDLRLILANFDVRAEHYDDAIKIYTSLLEKEPRSPDLLFKLAETERRKGDLNLAIENFRRCSQEATGDTQCLLQLGLLLEGTGKRDQAKPIYEQILKIQPDHPVALNNLAYIKAEEGVDLDQALTMAQRARQKAPGSVDIADTLGWIYIKKNLSEDAVRVFKDLVQKDPNNYSFHYHYGMALMQKGDRPSARKELETALQHKPSKDDEAKIREMLQKI
ncbi:MAG: tetratricopeptide repeat protein [Acidobacteriia bacterium]|nr:tetratricopeptide repeat protein [Terriglobia bacterium]